MESIYLNRNDSHKYNKAFVLLIVMFVTGIIIAGIYNFTDLLESKPNDAKVSKPMKKSKNNVDKGEKLFKSREEKEVQANICEAFSTFKTNVESRNETYQDNVAYLLFSDDYVEYPSAPTANQTTITEWVADSSNIDASRILVCGFNKLALLMEDLERSQTDQELELIIDSAKSLTWYFRDFLDKFFSANRDSFLTFLNYDVTIPLQGSLFYLETFEKMLTLESIKLAKNLLPNYHHLSELFFFYIYPLVIRFNKFEQIPITDSKSTISLHSLLLQRILSRDQSTREITDSEFIALRQIITSPEFIGTIKSFYHDQDFAFIMQASSASELDRTLIAFTRRYINLPVYSAIVIALEEPFIRTAVSTFRPLFYDSIFDKMKHLIIAVHKYSLSSNDSFDISTILENVKNVFGKINFDYTDPWDILSNDYIQQLMKLVYSDNFRQIIAVYIGAEKMSFLENRYHELTSEIKPMKHLSHQYLFLFNFIGTTFVFFLESTYRIAQLIFQ